MGWIEQNENVDREPNDREQVQPRVEHRLNEIAETSRQLDNSRRAFLASKGGTAAVFTRDE